MSIFSTLFGCCKKEQPTYPQDTVTARDGSQITFTFYAHASLGIEWNGMHMYVDPVGEFDWESQPKADLILVTHSHYDHLEMSTIEKLSTEKSVILCDKTSAEAFEHDCVTMLPRAFSAPLEGVVVKAVPAYNISEGHTDFHPKAREDCGYLITLGDTTIYVAGDTEDNDDVLALKDVDIAFLPVNQPYTMTVEQAARVVEAIRPSIFYPYHYGQVEQKTDIDALKAAVGGITDMRVFPME
ncbi:MAG: MBL fold metallo-hydrolase [Alistipes sp.]|nr:MBL fold metallo-hydrolase [Alistipes sp.]